jgi:neutral ceramidase
LALVTSDLRTLVAGAARITITPPVGTWQAGFGARTRPCDGVHDELYTRALVLSAASLESAIAIVAADLIGLEPDSVARIRRRVYALTGIAPSRVLVSCTHTHGGPATLNLAGLGDGVTPDHPVDPDYLSVVEKLLAGAVAAAARSLRPARLTLGEGAAAFHVNRRLWADGRTVGGPDPAGVVDRRVGVLRVDDATDHAAPPLAVLYHLACHPTAMGGENYLLTADWPGAVSRFVEASYGAAAATVALFLQGCAGNIRPNLTAPSGQFRAGTWGDLERIGRELGGEVVRATERGVPLSLPEDEEPLAAASTTATIPFSRPPDRAVLEAALEGSRWDRGWARAMARQLEAGGLPTSIEAEVQTLRIGALRLVAMPGEVFTEIGLRARQTLGEPAWALGYANGLQLGYVPTAAALAEGGYEVAAYRFWLHPAPLGPATEDLLLAATKRAAEAIGLQTAIYR